MHSNLHTLKEVYNNNCVDTSNAYDFSILIESKSMTISTTPHYCYIKQVDDLISLITKYLPLTFQIEYLTKEKKQDCISRTDAKMAHWFCCYAG